MMFLLKAKQEREYHDICELNKRLENRDERLNKHSASTSNVEEIVKVEELKPDDLPDGACFLPKHVVHADQSTSQAAVREAQYVGSFSVVGSVGYVQQELEVMRDSTKSKPIIIIISLSGVKVCSHKGESVFMTHALKRISYATCDPDYKQFSFLAREPKGQTNFQYCHVFRTETSEAAEELNTIIGNAFKMAYAQQRERQPTFHELIQQQVIEQQAKFKEVQEEEKRAFEKKLNVIATPTPFSEAALQMMEMRRQTSDEEAPPKKIWNRKWQKLARNVIEQVKHRKSFADIPPFDVSSNFKQAETPASNLLMMRPSTSQSPSHALTVAAIRESMDSNASNSNKSKGSPVTALKDEIDRRFMSNGHSSPSHNDRPISMITSRSASQVQEVQFRHSASENFRRQDETRHQQRHSMANRPLPAVPRNLANCYGSPKNRASIPGFHSFDDNNIPHASPPQTNGVSSRSPKRKAQRPMSEIVPSSVAGTLYDNRFAVNGFSPNVKNEEKSSLYIYGPNDPVRPAPNSPRRNESPSRQPGKSRMSRVETEPILRYQNDSPFQGEGEESETSSNRKGLESLMCLDRSHIADETLRNAPWYQAGIPREIALEILQQEDVGSFIVRDSTTHPGCFALSVRVPKYENAGGISHYLIIKTQRGVKLKGLDKEWTNLTALVIHHTVMREMLPCTLKLPRKSKNPTFKDSDKDDREDDAEYQRLADVPNLMDSMKI